MQESLNKFSRVTFQSLVADFASGQLGNCFSNNFCAESIPPFQSRRSKNLCHQRPYRVARLSSRERARTSAVTSESSALGVILRTNSEARFAARLSSGEVNGSISAPFFCDGCRTVWEGSRTSSIVLLCRSNSPE